MLPRALLASLSLLAFLFGSAHGVAPPAVQEQRATSRPNIVYVLADDLGIGDVGCFNADGKIATPHLDRLASEGMRFTDAHSGSAVCSPTRYGIVTGRYAWRSRLKRGVLGGSSRHLVPASQPTVASHLAGLGYRTGMIGKWHLGWDFTIRETAPDHNIDDFFGHPGIDFEGPVTNGPDINGFEYYYAHCGSLDMAPYVYVENGRVTAAPDRVTEDKGKRFWRKGGTGSDFDHEDVLPNFIRRAIDFVEASAEDERPFFLYLPLPAPHTPILPTEEFKGKSGTNEYGDFVCQVDHHVGELLEALERVGAAENTLFVFTADNGCSPMANFGELAAVDHHPSGPFRGHKADIFEGGHRVPYIARWPGRVAASSVSNQTICLTDLFATVADVTDTELAPNAGVDSVSTLPALLGEDSGPLREATVHHSINGSFAIRRGPWKLICCPGSGGWSAPKPKPARAAAELPLMQLYNLESDPGERTNVQAEYPEIVAELTLLLGDYVDRGRSTPGPAQSNEGDPRFLPKSR